ncbi:MAG: hypothetical protein WAQ52_03390 [Terriglobales bacterium]
MTARVIAIDWSGARQGAPKKIWLAEFRGGQPFDVPRNKIDPSEIVKYLVSTCAQHPNTVVGIDFAFSFPSWFIADQRCKTAKEVWGHVERNGERWLTECRDPFWGKPGQKNPRRPEEQQYRKTDSDIHVKSTRPKSIFQVGGAGAVGTGSIRGMPILRRLHGEGFSIWPFHPDGWPRVIEIWPRALTGEVDKSRCSARRQYISSRYDWLPDEWKLRAEDSEDAFDAVMSAIQMNKHLCELESLKQETDPQYLMEGRIWQPETA